MKKSFLLITLTLSITGSKLTTIEVDVTGKPVPNPVQSVEPLGSRFYRIIIEQ